jgi:hypothetical protein
LSAIITIYLPLLKEADVAEDEKCREKVGGRQQGKEML